MIVVGGGVFFAVDLVFWNSSVLLTSIATASLLSNSAPLWVGLGALLLFHEHLSFRYWCGLVIAICGMTILLGLEAWQGFHLNNGNFLALIAGGFYAGYILTTQRARQRFDTVTFMAVSGISSVIVLLAINLLMGTALWGFSNRTWLALLGIGLVSHLSGWLAINYALGHLRAAPVSVSLLGQVILSSLLAIPLFGESLNLHQILGGVAVLSGIYLANQRKSVKGEMKGNRWGGGKGNQ
jgi:drug/metabolite transporter (DMT)-like permease